MLTNREMTDALITNIGSWNWDLFTKFPIDQKTGEALVAEYKALKNEIAQLKRDAHVSVD